MHRVARYFCFLLSTLLMLLIAGSMAAYAVLTITTSSLPSGTQNVPYSATLTASGGTTPYTWSLVSTGLPAGLSLNSSTGVISGTPTGTGTSNFTVKVTDANSNTATKALSITINAALTITTSSLPAGTQNVPYSATLTASGGTTPYTWSIISGSLPAGLSLNASTGVISGTPTGTGTSNFTVKVTDASSNTATKALSITINAPLTITTSSLPAGTQNVAYSASLAASGGTTPYVWSIVSGSLPAGLSLSAITGAINGTPTGTGTSNFTVKVTDASSNTATKALSITINAPLTITTSSLPQGTQNAAYSATLAASGGVTPYTWKIVNSPVYRLPAGLSLNASSGAITGTPTGTGTSNFTVQVTDASSNTATKALSITINAPLTITTSSLPSGTQNVAYSATLAASGGVTPYTWSITVGTLPAGLSLNASSGAISGTPTGTGTSNFTVQVTDASSNTATKALNITINAPLTITTSSLPSGTQNVAYSATLAASGGVTPYTWSITAGSLPAGLSLNASSGAISGTPTGTGTSNFTVQVTDANLSTATKALSITINAPLTITTSSLPQGTQNVAYSATLAASGGVTPYTWSISAGSLPAGLSLNASSGAISGTPTGTGTSNFTVQVTDASSNTATKALSITINGNSSLIIATNSLPFGAQNEAYMATLAASGGSGSYSWSLVSGSLPAGLSLNAGSGVISGTPTGTGTSNFTVQVTDTSSNTATQPLSITINAPLTITTSSLPSGAQNVVYRATISASGGVLPYTWSISLGSLPAGLSLNATSGVISGTPTGTGTSNFTAKVTDVNSITATQDLSISINSSLVITTSSLPPGTQNMAYSTTLIASGGVTPYTWSVSAGSLPAGLSLDASSGVISGTPAGTGTSNFTVQVTDTVPNTATQPLSIRINTSGPTLASLSPVSGTVNTSVTILGSNFGDSQGTSTLTFNGVAATPISWTSTTIIAPVPSGASSGPVVVNVGGIPSNSLTFSVTGPTITSLNPSAGGAGTAVTISGTGLGASQGTSTVTFNGVAATPTSWADQNVIAPVPAGASSGPVVLTISGQPTNGQNFTVGPNIASITPLMGAPATIITISGSGFGATQGSSTVGFNGVPAVPSSWSDTSISVPVPANATTGPMVVLVGGYSSNGLSFTVAPSITNLSPIGGPVGVPVTVSGLNFGLTQGTASISFNGVAGTPTSWGPKSIVVPVPAGASTGMVIVTSGSQSSNGVTFTVGAGSIAGTVTRVSDGNPVPGASVQVLQANTIVASTSTASDGTYSVSNLIPGIYDVSVSASGYGTALSVGNSVTANQVTQVNVGLALPGTIAGQITQHDGQTPISGASITIFQGVDSVAQTSSDSNGMYSGSSLAAGSYSVQVTATGYNGQTQTNVPVTVGNTTPANFSLSNQSAITYEYDDAGRLIGVLDSQNGAAKYTYDPVGNILSISRMAQGQVSIIGFSPTSGPVGTTVVISGSGFSTNVGQDSVSFNGVAATISAATTTQITVIVPQNATTGPISVTAPGGSDTSTNPFVVTAGASGPTITGFSPLAAAAGTPVTVTGSGFDPTLSNNRLKFNSTFAVVSSVTNNTLSTTVPPQASSGHLVLTTPSGTAVSNDLFYVLPSGVCVSFDFSVPLSLNGQFGGTIQPNDCAMVTFNVNAGQKIDFSTTSTPDGNVIYLQSPGGTLLNQEYLSSGQDDIAETLPLTGTYVALIVNVNGSPFTINGTLYDNSDVLYTIDTHPITVSTHYGQIARVQFAGTNGTHITLHATNITYPPVFDNLLPASFSGSSGGPIAVMGSQDQTEADADLVFFQNDNYTMVIGPTSAAGSATLQLMPDSNFGYCGSINDGPTITTGPYQYCELSFSYDYLMANGIWINATPLLGDYSSYYKGCSATAFGPDGSNIHASTAFPCPWLEDYGAVVFLPTAGLPFGTYTILFGDAAGARSGGTATMGYFMPPF